MSLNYPLPLINWSVQHKDNPTTVKTCPQLNQFFPFDSLIPTFKLCIHELFNTWPNKHSIWNWVQKVASRLQKSTYELITFTRMQTFLQCIFFAHGMGPFINCVIQWFVIRIIKIGIFRYWGTQAAIYILISKEMHPSRFFSLIVWSVVFMYYVWLMCISICICTWLPHRSNFANCVRIYLQTLM